MRDKRRVVTGTPRTTQHNAIRPRATFAPSTDEIDEMPTMRAAPARKQQQAAITTDIIVPPPQLVANQPRRSWHISVFIGLGMMIALVIVLASQHVIGFFTVVQNDYRYGRPRTFHMDAFVGHETGKTPSHFIAMNRNGRIEIIQFPGGDASKARIFVGPQLAGENAELEPVTLEFVDTQKNGKPHMLVKTRTLQITFLNTGTTFKSP